MVGEVANGMVEWSMGELPMKTPLLAAVRNWVRGDEAVPTIGEFYSRFGYRYMNYRLAWDHPTAVVEYTSMGERLDDHVRQIHERDQFIKDYGFSLPSLEVLNTLKRYEPIVEIGGGTGFWSKLMDLYGVDVMATDILPCGKRTYGFLIGHVRRMNACMPGKTAVRHWRDRNVFCSWPSLNQTWFRQAARAMQIGRTLIVVREDSCAEDTAWRYIENSFEYICSVEIPCFYGLHDIVEVWTKKRDKRWRDENDD